MKTIREWREAAGLSQFQLAVRAGVVVQSISNWEVGRKRPSPARLQRLAEALGVRVDEIRLEARKDGKM